MRARTLVVAAMLAGAIFTTGGMGQEPVETAEAAHEDICKPPYCRKLSLFGIRFTPKLFKVEIKVPESTPRGELGHPFELTWNNGDATAHQIQSVLARDSDGVILGFRDPETDVVRCDGGGGCFEYDSGTVAARPRGTRLTDRRPPPFESPPVTITKTGTYTFKCAIHPTMSQTVLVSTKKPR